MRPFIMIATPCFGGLLYQDYVLSILKAMDFGAQTGAYGTSLRFLGNDALVSRARSTLVSIFMDDPRFTHMLFIDADISFEPAQLCRLVQADKDFSGAFYPIKAIDWNSSLERAKAGEPFPGAAMKYVGTLEREDRIKIDGNDFATAEYIGGGFQLIRRNVFERLFAAYPQSRFKLSHTLYDVAPASENLYALFDSMIDEETGAYLSEDYAFCRRFRAIGGEIWLDLRSRLTHTGGHNFVGDFETRLTSQLGEAAPLRGRDKPYRGE